MERVEREVRAPRQIAAPGLVEPIGEEREIESQVIGVISKMRVEEER